MCIVVAKPIDVEMPDMETLKRCFDVNPDGAGFMYADGKCVRIRKGFMTFEDFVEALDHELPHGMRTETAIVMHFRIETSGGVNQKCCHPFPVTDDEDKLRSTRIDARVGVAHNGVIQGRRTGKDWSDTMDFVAGIMTPLMRIEPDFMCDDDALDLLEDACGSKLAIMNHTGEIATVGKFYDNEGVLYSNTGYVKSTWRYSSYGNVWGDANYYGTYPDYGDGMSDLLDKLPFYACDGCMWAEECALTEPICDTEAYAEWLCAEIEEEEIMGRQPDVVTYEL